MGTGDGADMGYVYGVDLEQGQIRPERIRRRKEQEMRSWMRRRLLASGQPL